MAIQCDGCGAKARRVCTSGKMSIGACANPSCVEYFNSLVSGLDARGVKYVFTKR